MGPEVRVNAVAPGFIDGEWLQDGFGEAYEGIKAVVESQSLLDRVSTPDDVAAAILSLITGSDLVTAHVLPVDGGALHRHVDPTPGPDQWGGGRARGRAGHPEHPHGLDEQGVGAR